MNRSISFYFIILRIVSVIFLFNSCTGNNSNSGSPSGGIAVDIKYATGFKISEYDNFSLITVTEAFPDSKKDYVYGLLKNGTQLPDSIHVDEIVSIPIQSIVVTSTTHIPSLEMLGVEESLVGFPNLNYISSTKTRKRIEEGNVAELGQNETLNTERSIALDPDLVVSFGVDGENKALSSLKRAGIPVVYNGDWVEQDPLGKAEWIRFFAAFYNKQERADSIFKTIASNYEHIKNKALQGKRIPKVLSGAMFKDVWYLPRGESWAASLIADAHGEYIFNETTGTGSISMSIEEVLDRAQNADFWIAPNAYTSYSELKNAHEVYTEFEPFKNNNIFGFGNRKGATGGLLYYELAPNRPDWVLNDLAAIFHLELFPDYQPHFYEPLEP